MDARSSNPSGLNTYLTVAEVACLIRAHPETVLRYIRSGKIKVFQPDRRYLISVQNFHQFMESTSCHAQQTINQNSNGGAEVGPLNTGKTDFVVESRRGRQMKKALAGS